MRSLRVFALCSAVSDRRPSAAGPRHDRALLSLVVALN